MEQATDTKKTPSQIEFVEKWFRYFFAALIIGNFCLLFLSLSHETDGQKRLDSIVSYSANIALCASFMPRNLWLRGILLFIAVFLLGLRTGLLL